MVNSRCCSQWYISVLPEPNSNVIAVIANMLELQLLFVVSQLVTLIPFLCFDRQDWTGNNHTPKQGRYWHCMIFSPLWKTTQLISDSLDLLWIYLLLRFSLMLRAWQLLLYSKWPNILCLCCICSPIKGLWSSGWLSGLPKSVSPLLASRFTSCPQRLAKSQPFWLVVAYRTCSVVK